MILTRDHSFVRPKCESESAVTHPLAIGAVVTILQFQNGRLLAAGIATILRPASEPDFYFVRFRGEARIRKHLIFPDYQRDPTRLADLVNRHLQRDAREAPVGATAACGDCP
jgi:hypothetical protein